MAKKKRPVIEREEVVVKFVGDSGDGMQLTGSMFSDVAALVGNDLATFPDFPAEIRAPQNTVAGVSGFQVHMGSSKIFTTGDLVDVLVAMNPASLKANLKWAKKGATILTDTDAFDEKSIEATQSFKFTLLINCARFISLYGLLKKTKQITSIKVDFPSPLPPTNRVVLLFIKNSVSVFPKDRKFLNVTFSIIILHQFKLN